MNTILRVLISLLLLLNGVGAIYGGGNLILYPDGSSIQLSSDWLKHTPFENYLIPGIILFITNGLFSLFVLFALLVKLRNYWLLVVAQGAILTGWILIQIVLIQTIYFLHIILGSLGVALIIMGWMLFSSKGRQQQ